MKSRSLFCLAILLLLVQGCSQMPPSAWNIYKSNPPQKAFALLQPLAQEGNADAQFLVGRMLMLGEGISQDPVKAISFYQKAAAQHHGCAMNNLSAEYKMGKNVPRNYEIAFQLAEEAAQSHHPVSLTNLGEMYYLGQGRLVDKNKALSYYQQALQNGCASTAFLLGQYYLEAEPTQENKRVGLKWLFVHEFWQKENTIKTTGKNLPEWDYKARYTQQAMKATDSALRSQAYQQAQEWYQANKRNLLTRLELLQKCMTTD